MARIPNRQLVHELKSGHRLGCTHLVELYQDRLLGEAKRTFSVPHLDAEELVGDVLLTVVTKIDTFEFLRSDGDFHYWVMTIFRNKVRDYKRQRLITEGLFESFQETALEEEETYSSTEYEVMKSILRQYEAAVRRDSEDDDDTEHGSSKLQALVEALDQLEPWERVLLRCRALDVPYEEISRYTGKSARILKVYHARVKKKLVRILSERHPELKPV
jgi:RNA polymerase sigma factor (sigma-70 family)